MKRQATIQESTGLSIDTKLMATGMVAAALGLGATVGIEVSQGRSQFKP